MTTFKECTAVRYDEMLGAVPPAVQDAKGFLVGEPVTHRRCAATGSEWQPTFAAFVFHLGRYYEATESVTIGEYRAIDLSKYRVIGTWRQPGQAELVPIEGAAMSKFMIEVRVIRTSRVTIDVEAKSVDAVRAELDIGHYNKLIALAEPDSSDEEYELVGILDVDGKILHLGEDENPVAERFAELVEKHGGRIASPPDETA